MKSVVAKFIKGDIICRYRLLGQPIKTLRKYEPQCELPQGQPPIHWRMAQRRSNWRKPMDPMLATEKEVGGLMSWTTLSEKKTKQIKQQKTKERETKNTSDKKMRPRSFKEGNLIPRKILPNAKDSRWN
ncbi:hypothetical protein CR513_16237, partial [Mucuna pruriens]